MNGETYEAVMALSPKEIAKSFPLGAIEIPPKKPKAEPRFRPAEEGEIPNLSLRKLLRDRRRRDHTPRLLHRHSERGYTPNSYQALPLEPEAPPKEETDQFARKARDNQAKRRPDPERRKVMRSRIGKLRELGIEAAKAGRDPGPILDKAIEDLEAAK